jgi:hypothetical protein
VASDRSLCQGFTAVFGPLAKAALAQEVFVVEQQLVEAGASDIDQPELRLAGGRSSAAAFGDVLPAAAGGLHHLIHGAGVPVHEAFAEGDRGVVNDGARLKAAKVAVAAAGPEPSADWPSTGGFGGAVRSVRSVRSIR